MKALKSFFQKLLTKEFERAALQNDKQRTVELMYLMTLTIGMIGGCVMYFYDMNSYLSLFMLGLVSFFGWLLNRAGNVNRSAVILIAILLITIQFNIFAGFGIHDVAIIAWPAFIVFTGLLFGWRVIPYFTGLIMLLAVVTWLIPNAQLFSDYSDTGDLIVMLLILLAFCIIALSIIRSNEQSTRRLQQAEERFYTIYHSISDAILIHDPQTGAIIDVNDKMLEMFGYTRSEAIQLDILAISSGIPPYTQENALVRIKKSVTQGSQNFEWQVKDKSGRLFWVDINMKLATIANQSQVLVSVRDISERKQSEAALRVSEARYRMIAENTADVIWTMNLTTRKFTYVSPSVQKLRGYTAAEVLGQTLADALTPESAATSMRALQQRLEAFEAGDTIPRPLTYQVDQLHKDGRIVPTEVVITLVLNEQGRPVEVIGVSRDITERKRTELQQEVLYQVLRAVSNQLDLDLVVQSAVETIVRLTGYPHVCIALQDKDGTHWVVRAAAGSLAAESGASYLINRGVIGRVFMSGQTQWVRDNLDDPSYVRDVTAVGAPALRSEFVAAMCHGDRLLGALNIESERVDAFDEADVRMIKSLADMISLALENARLYEEAQQEITERKQAEEALRESEARYRTLFEQASDGIINLSTDLQILAVNMSFARMHGYSVEEIQRMRLQDLDTPKSTQLSIERVRRILAGEIIEFEVEHYHKDGHIFPLEVSTGMISVGGQNIIQAFNRDITERKRAQQALLESEERFRTLIEQAPVAIAISRNGMALYGNPKFMEILGFQRAEEIVGRPVFELFAPQYRKESEDRSRRRSLGLSVPNELESVALRSDGSQFPVHLNIATVQLPDGAATMGFVTDITERKRTEETLRENEEKYRRLFDNAPLGIFQSSPAGEVISINPAFAHLLGYDSPEDAIKNIQNVATDLFADPNRRAEIICLMTEDSNLRTFESEYRRKDGSTFIGQLNVTPVRDADGCLVRTEGMLEDITERKQAEVKIRAALEEKETLLREVHHRVKNNLQAMIALIDMQAGLIPDEDTRQFLKELEGQARTMALVYEQLYQSVNLARVQMAPYLQQLTTYISETFGGRRMVQLSLDVGSVALDVAQAMPCGLIVNELFTNILKHAFPPDFQRQPAVSITLQFDGESYHLTVADNGVGLPSGYDWQASRSMGLRLVNLWVTHQLGGALTVRCDPGAIYTIAFPKTAGGSS